MDEKLKRVLELTAQFKEAVEACPDVLSVYLPSPGTRFDGVHESKEENENE